MYTSPSAVEAYSKIVSFCPNDFFLKFILNYFHYYQMLSYYIL